jgi:hypothetical protein
MNIRQVLPNEEILNKLNNNEFDICSSLEDQLNITKN